VIYFTKEAGKRLHIPRMDSDRTRLPIVEVTAPDGGKSLWVAAVPSEKAVAAVKAIIPSSHVARLTEHRFSPSRKSDELGAGEVRRISITVAICDEF
jgi:hypothetical protein